MECRWGFMLLLSMQLLSAGWMSATPYSWVFGIFFPLIHVSDLRRGALKGAAPRRWSSCPHSCGVTLLGFPGSLTFPVGISLWDEHPPFVAPLLAQLRPSHPDPRGSGGKAGAGVDCRVNERLFPAGLSTPIPGRSGDRECLVFLHQHCRKVGMLWWATS